MLPNVDRLQALGAKEKTGTRAFMAIGVLSGDDHSFMDDLESFFWVLFWVCIHYDGQGRGRTGYFTPYYQVMMPWIEKSWEVVFPNSRSWRRENQELYSQMRQIFRDAQNDPLVAEVDS
ncbi:hypothetical protein F4678DRAFT_468674 [Xylaria arbuscula]|nr:hypothetical protein F4678DRAFT_468674 [Xylaria arbuscula]